MKQTCRPQKGRVMCPVRASIKADTRMIVHVVNFTSEAFTIAGAELLVSQRPLSRMKERDVEGRRPGLISGKRPHLPGISQRQLGKPRSLTSDVASKGLFHLHRSPTALPGLL